MVVLEVFQRLEGDTAGMRNPFSRVGALYIIYKSSRMRGRDTHIDNAVLRPEPAVEVLIQM